MPGHRHVNLRRYIQKSNLFRTLRPENMSCMVLFAGFILCRLPKRPSAVPGFAILWQNSRQPAFRANPDTPWNPYLFTRFKRELVQPSSIVDGWRFWIVGIKFRGTTNTVLRNIGFSTQPQWNGYKNLSYNYAFSVLLIWVRGGHGGRRKINRIQTDTSVFYTTIHSPLYYFTPGRG